MTLLHYLPRFRQAYRELPVLETREAWSRGEIETFQVDRLNALWAHAVAHVPYYRELAARLGLPGKFRDLAEYAATVPVTPREAVRARPLDFLSERAGPGAWRLTSGSTGAPVTVYWPHDAARETLRYRYRLFARWGVDVFDRQAVLWGDGATVLQGPARVLAVARRRVTD